MTPKEKAQQLFENYYNLLIISKFETAKQQSLIAVDEILKITSLHNLDYKNYSNDNSEFKTYWQEVKTEIEAL